MKRKKNRKFSPEIKEILEKYKEENLRRKHKRVLQNLRNGAGLDETHNRLL